MAQTIKLKRSATSGAVPTTGSLELGEVAINTYDGKMYIKKNDGTESVVEIGASSEYLPLSGGTLTGNVSFGDNDKAIFGAGSDLQIYHDGSNSVIKDVGAGDLNISAGNDLRLQDSSGNNYFKAGEGGASKIYYAGAEKLATTSTGIDVAGTAVANGFTLENNAEYINVKNSSGTATRAFGVNAANNLYIGGIDADIGPILFVDNGATLATLGPTGLDVAGNVDLPDNGKLLLGASDDLQIYHDGNNSYIVEQGTGNLRIAANDFELKSWDTNETYMSATTNGEVSLRFNNAEKLATTATGINVTGTATVDGLTVDGNATIGSVTPRLNLMESDTTDLNSALLVSGGNFSVRTQSNANALTAVRLNIDNATGDISFREDTGTTAKFYWDASAESLGIGGAPSGYALDVTAPFGSAIGGAYIEAGEFNKSILTLNHTNSSVNVPLLSVQKSGSDVVTVDSAGRVGIGTSSPSEELEIASTSPTIRLTDTNDSTYGAVSYNVGALFLTADQTIRLNTDSVERLRIDSSGRVGIGRSPTSHILETAGEIKLTSLGANQGIDAYNTSSAQWGIKSVSATGAGVSFEVSATERMRIDSAGAVTAYNSLRAPIFYDSGNTGNYLDSPTSSVFRLNGSTAVNLAVGGTTKLVADTSGIDVTGRIVATENTDALRLRSSTNGVGVNINFSDHAASSYLQNGSIRYVHSDTHSYGSGNAFIVESTEPNMTFLADGKLMFKEGLYLKPATGTGAGSQIISSDGTFSVPEYIYHQSNTGTYLRYLTDRIILRAGSGAMIDFNSNGQLYMTGEINAYNDIDIVDDNLKMGGTIVIDSSRNLKNVNSLQFSDTSPTLQEDNNYLRIQTSSGWTSMGSGNSSWSHFFTDRGGFYFGTRVNVNGEIRVYNTSSVINSTGAYAPAFYDSDNTAYYVNPASTSNLEEINLNSGIIGRTITDQFTLNGKSQPHYGFNLNPTGGVPIGISGYYGISFATQGAERFTINQNGDATALVSSRAPIFYDSNNTAYYVNPASTSVMNTVYIGGSGGGYISRNPGSQLGSMWIAAGSNGTGGGNTVVLAGGNVPYVMADQGGTSITGDLTPSGTLYLDNPNNSSTTDPNIDSKGELTSGTAYSYHALFKDGNGVIKGRITHNQYGAQFSNLSDYRAKEDYQEVENATSRLMSIPVRNFQWIGSDLRTDGFLAHEIAEVVPEAVVGEKDAVLEDGTPDYQSIDQSKIVPLLVKTIQELEARLSALENA